nr:carboxypeptidase regulatory-like domain-containing protein [Rhabdobacter roseus]
MLVVVLVAGCTEDTYVEPKLYGSVAGQILTQVTKEPVANALIRISPSGRSAETDSLGRFKVDSLLVDKYGVQTTKSGYRSDLTNIEIEPRKQTNIVVYLVEDNLQNRAPTLPGNPFPADGATNVTTSVILDWTATDPEKDTLRYDVILFREGNKTSVPIATNILADSLVVNGLDYGATYYWQVIARDRVNNTVYGQIWSFRTRDLPDFPYFFARRETNNTFQIVASNAAEQFSVTKEYSNWRPIVSPNRTQLAFISNRNTEAQLFVSDLNGNNLRQVTTVPIAGLSVTDLSFCWSPDGTELLYPSYDKLYAIRPNGTGLRLVAQAPSGRFFAGCDWTEQGNRIVARATTQSIYDNELYLINPATGQTTRLVGGQAGRMSNPAFSVDGRRIVYSLDVSNFQNPQGRQLDARIFLMDIAAGTSVDLSAEKTAGTNDLEPRFAPDGARIIFTNTNNDGISTRGIYSMDLAGKTRTLLVQNAEMPYWR